MGTSNYKKDITKDQVVLKNHAGLLDLNQINRRLARVEKDIFLLSAERIELNKKKDEIMKNVEQD